MLPSTLHTQLATFHFTSALEPGHNLPGFWSTELSTTRSKFYNGMMRALYTAYTTSGKGQQTGDHNMPGIRPSVRWYQYRQHMRTTAHTGVTQTAARPGRGGRRASGDAKLPGRGHPSHPPISSAGGGSTATAPHTPSSPSTDITLRSSLTTAQQFEQILTLCQTSITETRGVRAELSNDRDAQARINTDLRNSLAKAHAAIDALTSTLRK